VDLTTSPKVTTSEGKGVGVRSFIHNTLGVEGCGIPRWGLGRLTSNQSLTQTCTKPNNKLVNA
jgi:hypothetical protein